MEKQSIAMVFGFALIATGVWMFSEFSIPKVEVIFYILAGVLFLVLNNSIQYAVKAPYYFCLGVSAVILPYVIIRLIHYLDTNFTEWKVCLTVLTVLGIVNLITLFRGRPS